MQVATISAVLLTLGWSSPSQTTATTHANTQDAQGLIGAATDALSKKILNNPFPPGMLLSASKTNPVRVKLGATDKKPHPATLIERAKMSFRSGFQGEYIASDGHGHVVKLRSGTTYAAALDAIKAAQIDYRTIASEAIKVGKATFYFRDGKLFELVDLVNHFGIQPNVLLVAADGNFLEPFREHLRRRASGSGGLAPNNQSQFRYTPRV